MKLRYVGLLTIAAALFGAGVAKHWSGIEQAAVFFADKPLSAKEQARRMEQGFANDHKRHYENIAEALIWLCSFDGTARDEFRATAFSEELQRIEREWAAETEKLKGKSGVLRIGPKLQIAAEKRSVALIDDGYLCGSSDVRLYRYREKLQRIGYHVIDVNLYEGAIAILASPLTGEMTYADFNVAEAPDGQRLASWSSEEGYEGGFEILRVDGDRIVSEFRSGDFPDKRHPVFAGDYLLEVIGWVDNESMLLLMSRSRQAKFFRRDSKWQLEYVNQ